jgi:hypothetical protein
MITKKMYLLALSASILASVTSVHAQKKKALPPEFSISIKDTETHMRFLAADELMGRRTGEQGNFVAARYIAEQYRKLGIKPLAESQNPNKPNNGYFQSVPFEKLSAPGAGKIMADAETLESGTDWILMSGQALEATAPLVYAGFGLEDSSKGWDDYKGLDVKGKIVLIQSGTAEVQTPAEIIASSAIKRKIASEKGALAVIELFNAPMPWNMVTRYFAGEKISLVEGTNNTVSETIPHIWANGKESRITRALRGVSEIKLSTAGRSTKRTVSYNVAGFIEGTDPKLKDEYVLLSAHYDHVGVGKQGGQAYQPEDSIFNGARDNAFGTVALLSAAEALSKNPPKRSVLLVALTGEEIGLLGSKYYVEHPLLPLNKCIFNINTDGAGYSDTTLVAIMGLTRTGAQPEFEKAVKTFGLTPFADPAPEQGLFDRSDNVNFAKVGIPAPTFSPGFTDFNPTIMKYYHQAIDNPETIDFNYLLKYSQSFAYAARLIADMKVAPKWITGDKYEKAANELYKK